MYTNFNFMIPEERKSWRSAQEIEMSALKHESRWRQMMQREEFQLNKPLWTGFLSFLKASLALLTALNK